MTHEQKPESAEFRTLETQVSECARNLHASLIALEEKLYVEFTEAEARGAAEQRRKDAEGAEVAGKVIATFESGEFMVGAWPDDIRVEAGSYVYARPANVAALEARVKELEGEVTRLKTPDWYISQEEEDGADSIADLMECHDPWEIIEIDGSRIVQEVWAFIDAEGEIRQFGTKEDAQSDIAAIREGGEHG